jgi:hypothetical protein
VITRWGRQVDPDAPLPEYPRPQLVRSDWVNLNGRWDYAFTATEAEPVAWDGQIVVPFSPETELSGVGRQLLPEEWLWYRRTVATDPMSSGRLLLHFGAVDQVCTVWIDDVEVGAHTGGYLPFTIDITEQVKAPEFTITVRVQDFSETHFHARGKQRLDRGRIWYTAQSGIWQTVWLERVPEVHVTGLLFTPDISHSEVEVTVSTNRPTTVALSLEGKEHRFPANTPTRLPVADLRLWSPSTPELYDVTVTAGEEGRYDEVTSYFAMREFGIDRSQQPPGLTLNGEPIVHVGLLDQGYWPESLLTPPSDEAMVFDITTARDLGFNMLRKHIKIEPLRWYHHCDRLGMLVWQDMVNGGGRYRHLVADLPAVLPVRINDKRHDIFDRADPEGREQFLVELRETITHLANVPSICTWVPFNEAWGQFDANATAKLVRDLDPTRLVDHASGWIDQGGGDFHSFHRYWRKFRVPRRPDRKRVTALTEYGGYSVKVAGHVWSDTEFGYQHHKDLESFTKAFIELHEQLADEVAAGISVLVYTQLSDVEDELNGLLTYDREVVKFSVDASAGVRRLMGGLGARRG